MRIALISDIHGNFVSLEAVLRDIGGKRVDSIICLGDVIATGPRPVECLERVRDLKCPVIMGNTDERFLTGGKARGKAGGKEVHMLEDMDRWTASQLSGEHLSFIRTFEATCDIEISPGVGMLCYHGSPRSNTEMVSSSADDSKLRTIFADHGGRRLYAGGHTHAQLFRKFGTSTIFNPGSVGLPFENLPDGTAVNVPRGEYAVLESEGPHLSIEFCHVPVDVRRVVEDALSSGLPHAEVWAGDWQTG